MDGRVVTCVSLKRTIHTVQIESGQQAQISPPRTATCHHELTKDAQIKSMPIPTEESYCITAQTMLASFAHRFFAPT
eukprot:scaffold35960_cov20-Prasinocladus_malaysianus.AAC.2